MNASPTFVATFEDGEVTRLTTYQHGETLALGRGVRFARAAHESRMKENSAADRQGALRTRWRNSQEL
jgi:hypothetical protein